MLGDLLAIPDWFLNYYSGYILYPSVPNNIQYIIISYVFEMVESPSLTKNMFAANPMLPASDPAYPLTCSNPCVGLVFFYFLKPKTLKAQKPKP